MTTDEFGVVGFAFTIKGLDLAGYVGDLVLTSESCADLQRMCRALRNAGIEQAPKTTAAAPVAPMASTDDAPVCKYHGKMKPSKFGGWMCTSKMGDGSYCKETAK